MIKVKVDNGQYEAEFKTVPEAQAWVQKNVDNNSWGLPERWVTEQVAIAQGKNIEDAEETRETTIGNQTIAEYRFLADYVYSIIPDTIEDLRADKLRFFSGLSLSLNDELRKANEYRTANMEYGLYDSEPEKKESYRQAFIDRSNALRNEYKRVEALVNAANTEAELDAITWEVE